MALLVVASTDVVYGGPVRGCFPIGDHRVSLTGTCYSDREENAVINMSMDALVWLRKQLEADGQRLAA